MSRPTAGVHYPRSLGEFQRGSDRRRLSGLPRVAALARRLRLLGVRHRGVWRLGDRRLMCPGCGARTSATAGTIFDRTRTPLTVWFTACWLFATQKDGISALALQRALGIGSYQTAWAMLHRLRSVLVRPGRELLQGRVEVDETYIGGDRARPAGGRAKGKKALVGIAVERIEPRGFGRCRMAWLLDASGDSLRGFLTDHVDPARRSSPTAGRPTARDQRSLHPRARRGPGAKASDLMPGVHRVASLVQALAARHPSGRRRRLAPQHATSTSSSSASTAAAHAAAAWSSTACSTRRRHYPVVPRAPSSPAASRPIASRRHPWTPREPRPAAGEPPWRSAPPPSSA